MLLKYYLCSTLNISYGQLLHMWKWDLINWGLSLEESYFYEPVKIIADHGLAVMTASNSINVSKLQLILSAYTSVYKNS